MPSLPCYFAFNGLNYKNGFATTCPISAARLENLKKKTPSQFWNNKHFKNYRKLLHNGKWPKECHLCKDIEQKNLKSMRQDYAADLTHYNIKTGQVHNKGLKHIELRFSNRCNMACLHCNDVYSSQWESRLKNYIPDSKDIKYNLSQLLKSEHKKENDNKKINLDEQDVIQIVQDLNKNFPNIEKIDFAGGEVLVQNQFYLALELLAKHPNAKNIQIFFHTNFNANFSIEKLNSHLLNFGGSKIKISVDASDKIYGYFRDGDVNTLKNNIKKFKEINDKTIIGLVNTVSVYQLMDIKNIYDFFLSLEVDSIGTSIVYNPTYLNPAIISTMFKKEIFSDLNDCETKILQIKEQRLIEKKNGKKFRWFLQEFNNFNDILGALRGIKLIKNYLSKHTTDINDYTRFIQYSEKIDKLWGKNFNQHFDDYKILNGKIVRNIS